MKVRCLNNKGEALRTYEYQSLNDETMGRFGSTAYSEYNELDIGKDYIVMGIIIFETYQAYLIDDSGLISACPCQLFEPIDNKVNRNWFFRLINKNENIYPFIQAIFGYYELCVDKNAYENLIVDREEGAQRTYFKRKIEFENELGLV